MPAPCSAQPATASFVSGHADAIVSLSVVKSIRQVMRPIEKSAPSVIAAYWPACRVRFGMANKPIFASLMAGLLICVGFMRVSIGPPIKIREHGKGLQSEAFHNCHRRECRHSGLADG
jgi:hypothetical protein